MSWNLTPSFLLLTFCSCSSPGEGGGRRGGGGGGKFHGVDLLQHSPSPSPSPGEPFPHQPHSLEPVSESAHQNLPLRKTHSDLDSSSSAAGQSQGTPPHHGVREAPVAEELKKKKKMKLAKGNISLNILKNSAQCSYKLARKYSRTSI